MAKQITTDNYGRHHITDWTFANPGISDETAEHWSQYMSDYEDCVLSIGKHRSDIVAHNV